MTGKSSLDHQENSYTHILTTLPVLHPTLDDIKNTNVKHFVP